MTYTARVTDRMRSSWPGAIGAIMRLSRLSAALVVVLSAAPVLAQPAFEGKTIVAIHVAGLVHVKESIVIAQIESKVGQPFHRATADHDMIRLDRLGVFGEISLVPVEVEGGVRVDLTFTETPHILPTIAIAVTDQDGASAGPAVKLTSIKGYPIDVGVTTRFGGETIGQFHETSMQFTDRPLWHSANLSLSKNFNKLDEFEQKSVDLDSRIGLRKTEQWRNGAIFKFYSVRADESGITLSSDNHDKFYSIGGVTEYDNRDSFRDPTRGWFNSVDALWTTGSGQFATLDIDVRRYQPLTKRQTLLATTLLTVQSGVDGVNLPTYSDYAIGGENTVRGQPYAAKRGKNQFISTLEYRYAVVPTRSFRAVGLNLYAGLAVAVFGDLGAAWNDPDAFSDSFVGGGGIGLRLYIPYVNMLRLDLSYGNSWTSAIGINEKAVAQRNRVR